MKFESRKPVEMETWQKPIKLNRKDLRREQEPKDGPEVGLPVAVGPMLGPDGKPVIGVDGKIVMVDAEGKPIHGERASGAAAAKPKEKGQGRKKFQKKTKQVFLVPEATRQLRREERYPWVMEDAIGSQTWVGMLDDVHKADTHAMFLPTADNVFKFVPPHRWYRFQKKPNHKILSLEEAEKLMAAYQKHRNPEQWLAARTGRKGQGPQDSNSPVVKAEEIANPHILPIASLVYESGQSAGPGGRQLRAVNKGSLFGDDDDDEEANLSSRRKERDLGGEGDADEVDFEEDFADDDEKYPEDNQDEETKELEERIKKEYRKAKAVANGDFVEDSDDEDEQKLSGAGKQMQKMLRKNDKSGQYDDSDDEKNPYASSEEEEEPDPAQTYTGPAIQAPPPRPGSQPPATSNGTTNQPNAQVKTPLPGGSGSRPTSPVPTQNGHSLVAKRATSPKVPRDQPKMARASSPLAQTSTTPGSPTSAPKPHSQKRKAEETGPPSNANGAGGGTAPKKRRRATIDGELDDSMVIDWLRNSPSASTRDCIQHFTPYLTDEAKKVKFTSLIKEVAQLKAGVLVLRNQFK